MRLIKVVYGSGHRGTVPASALGQLIARNDITAFQRSDGWVTVAEGPLRLAAPNQPYLGPRRRQSDCVSYLTIPREEMVEPPE
jgi:hypothetical protein